MVDFPKLTSWFVEEFVSFRSAFLGLEFDAVRAIEDGA